MEPSREEMDQLISMLIDIRFWYLFGIACSGYGVGIIFMMVIQW